MTDSTPRVYVLQSPGDAWPCAEELSAIPGGDRAVVELDGRQIEAALLIECWQWLFNEK